MNSYKEYSSFISEHTAEYVLIPRITTILKTQFKNVAAIYPWLTREGTNLSKSIHKEDFFIALCLFCKRPKISNSSNKTLFKINQEFLNYSKNALKLGIPAISGCPIVDNFWKLDSPSDIIWSKLEDTSEMYFELRQRQTESYFALSLPMTYHLKSSFVTACLLVDMTKK